MVSEISSGFRLNIADSGDGDNVFWIAPDFTESSLLKGEDCPFLQLTDESNKMRRLPLHMLCQRISLCCIRHRPLFRRIHRFILFH
jgi:hypothetical protein